MLSLYKKLNLTKAEFKEMLIKKYWEDEMSQSKIAKDLNCNRTCIEDYFRILKIETRSYKKAGEVLNRKSCNISQFQHEVISGMMLSDFHIEKRKCQSRITFGFKHEEFARHFIKILDCFEWSEPKFNEKTKGWHSKTISYNEIHNLRALWYPEDLKRAPVDLVLTPKILLYWYLGDGWKAKGKNGLGYGAGLATDALTLEGIKILKDKLHKMGFEKGQIRILENRNRLLIIGKSGYQKLLDIIGECPVECYRYKWN